MANAGSLEVTISATTDGLRAGLQAAIAALEGSVPKMKIAAAAIGTAIVGAMAYSVNAFAQAERAATGLAVALRNQGGFTRQNLISLLEYDEQLERHSRFTKEEILEGQTLLVNAGLRDEALKRATLAMANLGTQTGSVTGAAKLLANAFEGNATGLHKYQINIAEGTAKTRIFNEVLEQTEKKFSGRAQEDANSLDGKLKQLKKTIDNMAETIGQRLSPAVDGFLTYISSNR
ncbi:MAG: hypothetical protein AAB817_02460, partial [Patescibacteria group bacterium]